MPCTTTIPNSARCARNAFASIVCCRIGSALVRCSIRTASWPALLTGTHTRPTARPGPGGVGSSLGMTANGATQRKWIGRSMSALPGYFRRQLVPLWQGHHRPQCRGTGQYFRSLCARVAAARLADYQYVGRSGLPWSVVVSGSRKGVGLGLCMQSTRRRAAHIVSS